VSASGTLRIGTRGSALALWQAHWVRDELRRHHPGLAIELQIIKTTGDRILDSPLSKIGDKGLFTREIEQALLRSDIALAVHSLKDLPTELPAGLALGAVTEREDVRDVFIPHPRAKHRRLADLPAGSVLATGSLRRRAQLLAMGRGFSVVDLRGNLNTRMRRLEESDWAGMILARAGVVRLGWEDRIGETIDPGVMLPAVGQGALGIEIRREDARTRTLISALEHVPTRQAATAERALLHRLEGGCQVPLGTMTRLEDAGGGSRRLVLEGIVATLAGDRVVRGKASGAPEDAEQIGTSLAERLLADGADEILRQIRNGT
jgi:hydroxymethylbilane synthase